MYQVLARKWRPRNFEELVGQQQVARTLANAVESDRLAHAYIFAGLRGTGKTSAARILAKCLNCEQGPTTSPCGSCPACREIADGQSMDVLEIDAASRTKVEQTRELLELVSYAPVRDRYKVLIIDEAHMLSKASFNALLKTLEEPPPNVLFLLATTELQKILPTILSRCQVFEFRRVAARDTAAHLRRLCDAEGITVSDSSLDRIARAGEGSVRDALSVLERVLAFCGSQIDDEDVLRQLGTVRGETLAEMVRAMASHDAAGMLGVLDGLMNEGHDLVHFWGQLIAAVRDLLMMRTAPDRPDLLARSADEASALAEAASALGEEDLSRIFHALAELEQSLKTSGQPRYVFEAALIRIAHLGAVRPIEELLSSLESGPDVGPRGGGSGAAPDKGQRRRHAPRNERTPASSTPPRGGDTPVDSAPAAADLAGAFVTAVQRARPMLSAILDAASEVRVEGSAVAIVFPSGKEALRRQLERSDNRKTLSECARAAVGAEQILLSTSGPEVRTRPRQATAATAARAAGPATSPVATVEQPSRPGRSGDRDALIRQANRDPGVRRLLREFGAQVVDIRPLDPSPPPMDGASAEPPGEVEDV